MTARLPFDPDLGHGSFPVRLLLPVCIALAFMARLLYRHLRDPLRDIPGPWLARYTRLWLYLEIRNGRFHTKNIELHRRYGPIVRIAPNEYSIDDPDSIRTIYGHGTKFIKSPWYTASGPPSQHEGVVVSIFSDRNPARHAENRRKVANAYALSALIETERYIDSTMVAFFQHLDHFASSGESFNLGNWLQFYAFDVIGELTFGKRFGFLDEGRDVNNIMENLETGLRRTAPLGVFHELHYPCRQLQGLWARFAKSPAGRTAVAAFTRKQIQSCEKERDYGRRDFLSRFMEIHLRSPEKLTEGEVFQVCLTQITAGSDTTAISLRAILYYLYRDPTKLEALRAEISQKMETGELSEPATYQQTIRMPYLQAVIKEALRLHPATGLVLGRVVPPGGSTISGRFFPAGKVVGINTWVAHANEEIFGQDAERFRPERWLCSKEEYARLDRYFMAFGLGSRTCLGKNIAIMEIAKLVPQIVRNFDVIFEEDQWQLENIWFVKQTGLQCVVKRRDAGTN